ncbi:MAG: glycosyltransferase family 39 protein [Flavobacteriales bacterium]|nr:glycosyltransferase family 39 protein [Flavobacteriales bacterium]MCB9178789.1 glycosyltransferase family 39 protein [Flavobacteriales bacterium]
MDWRRHIARYGDGWFPGEPWLRWSFLALLVLAAVLRFWNLAQLPFTHDELSALMRIHPTLGGTVRKGVIELDTHPPGVQVFEWAWTKLFGTSEVAVKFPFILLAVLALFPLYRFALAWTSAGTALVSIALLATLQYTVLYAQIARPYAIGFFTTAVLADQLTRHLAFHRRRNLAIAIAAAVASGYVHHFALLLAGIMVASVFVLQSPAQRKNFLIAMGIMVLCYAANIPILLKQLGYGGLGNWLPPPDNDWIGDYLAWVFHFSLPLMLLVSALVVYGLIRSLGRRTTPSPAVWLLPAWGLAPLVIGYAYSIWRSPVLQYSLLLFSFPYLLFWLFAGMRHAGRTFTLLSTAVLASLATVTLYTVRQHHLTFRDSPYAAMVRIADEALHEPGDAGTLVLFDAPRPQVTFHLRRKGLSDHPAVHWPSEEAPDAIDRSLHDPTYARVVLGMANGGANERIAQVQAQFPYISLIEDHVEGQVFVMERVPSPGNIRDRHLLGELSPSRRVGLVDLSNDLPMVHDPTTRRSGWGLAGREYGPSLHHPLGPADDPQDLYEAEILLSLVDTAHPPALVLQWAQGDTTISYLAKAATTPGDAVLITAALSPSWASGVGPEGRISTYVHDRDRSAVVVHRIRLYKRRHDPVRDALLRPVKDLGFLPR